MKLRNYDIPKFWNPKILTFWNSKFQIPKFHCSIVQMCSIVQSFNCSIDQLINFLIIQLFNFSMVNALPLILSAKERRSFQCTFVSIQNFGKHSLKGIRVIILCKLICSKCTNIHMKDWKKKFKDFKSMKNWCII